VIIDVLKGKDELDATSVAFQDPLVTHTNGSLDGITIGIPREYHVEGLSDIVLDTWSKAITFLESLGARIETVSLPHTSDALSAYYIIAPAEAYSNLAAYDGVRYGLRKERSEGESSFCRDTRTTGFGNEVKRRLMVGAHVLKSLYFQVT
jgi:aspartyl-tRNA(Asn)/glutamyl-tRNA(Gln) amidotransferase subunit A